jgi:beta-mannosidase
MSIEAFRELPARFCSEFGLESFPSMRAVRTYTDKAEPDITEPVMMAHQKSAGGNQKILFYLLAKYREPKYFADMVYLSQLVQSGAMRFAVDQWRRHIDRCGGALYWQFNDCWPVASWAGIDYHKQYKAVHYHARHFNKPVCLSNDYFNNRAEIYLANDLPKPFTGKLDWQFQDFSGKTIASGQEAVETAASSAKRLITLNYSRIIKGFDKKSLVLYVTLEDQNGVVDEKNYLLAPDKNVHLPKPKIAIHAEVEGATAKIKFSADAFARYVYAEIDGIEAPLSDNFFDIPGGGNYAVTVPVPGGTTGADIEKRITVRTLVDVEAKRSLAADRALRFGMRFKPINLITWFLFKFIANFL